MESQSEKCFYLIFIVVLFKTMNALVFLKTLEKLFVSRRLVSQEKKELMKNLIKRKKWVLKIQSLNDQKV